MTSYPKVGAWLEEFEPHKEIIVVYRSKLNFVNHYIAFFFSLAVVVYAISYLREIPAFATFSFRWFALIPVGILLETLRQLFNNVYVVTRGSIMAKEGRWSLNYRSPSIRYSDIRAVTVRQNFWGRILDVGDVVLDTAAQETSEVLLLGVSNPDDLARMIEEMRDYSEKRGTMTRD